MIAGAVCAKYSLINTHQYCGYNDQGGRKTNKSCKFRITLFTAFLK